MISVRLAEVADVDQIFTLTSDFATSFRPDAQALQASLARLIRHSDARVLVAVETAMIVGYLLGFDHDTLFANGRVAWIEELMVREDRRRNGIGRMLVERFERWTRERGERLVGLATRRAAAFYAAIGYEESAAYFRKLM